MNDTIPMNLIVDKIYNHPENHLSLKEVKKYYRELKAKFFWWNPQKPETNNEIYRKSNLENIVNFLTKSFNE